jgi:hypothetical protein
MYQILLQKSMILKNSSSVLSTLQIIVEISKESLKVKVKLSLLLTN